MSLWWLSFSCRQVSPSQAISCLDSVVEHSVTEDTVRLHADGCGDIILSGFQVAGDGEFIVDLFADGERTIPKITSTRDGSLLRGLVADGTIVLSGFWPIHTWRLGESIQGSTIVMPDELERDKEGFIMGEGSSSWAGLAGRGDGASVLLGARSAATSRLSVGFGTENSTGYSPVYLAWTVGASGQALDEGQSLWLDPLFVAMGPQPALLFEEWSTRASPSEMPNEPPPLGWSVPEGTNEDVLHDTLNGNPFAGVVRIAPGWENNIGDWQAGALFPSGTAALAEEIRAAGAVPGLAWSPLVAARSAPIWALHPDWWVTDLSGGALDWNGLYILDVTNEQAAAWLASEVEAKVAEGWLYQRLDHLEAGAATGVRATGAGDLAAYRLALEIIREAAPEVWLVAGPNAPLLPTRGLIDAIALDSDDEWEILAALSFTVGRWWWLEARPLSSPADLARLSAAALAGGGLWWSSPSASALSTATARSAGSLSVRAPLLSSAPDVPLYWDAPPFEALINLTDRTVTAQGPGGQEVWSGQQAQPGDRSLPPGAAELWRLQ